MVWGLKRDMSDKAEPDTVSFYLVSLTPALVIPLGNVSRVWKLPEECTGWFILQIISIYLGFSHRVVSRSPSDCRFCHWFSLSWTKISQISCNGACQERGEVWYSTMQYTIRPCSPPSDRVFRVQVAGVIGDRHRCDHPLLCQQKRPSSYCRKICDHCSGLYGVYNPSQGYLLLIEYLPSVTSLYMLLLLQPQYRREGTPLLYLTTSFLNPKMVKA